MAIFLGQSFWGQSVLCNFVWQSFVSNPTFGQSFVWAFFVGGGGVTSYLAISGGAIFLLAAFCGNQLRFGAPQGVGGKGVSL